MIGLSATTYDPAGILLVDARPDSAYHGLRRGSVAATLDGGVSVYDGGYTVADQVMTATIRNPTKAILDTLQYLVAFYSQVVLCCETGAFSAIPGFELNRNILTLNLRLTGRLDT